MAKTTKKTDSVPPPAAEQTTSALVPAQAAPLAKHSYDAGDDAGMGFEDAGKGLIPWLVLFQSNSPQVEEGLVSGAKAGHLFNTATNELYDAEVEPGESLDGKGVIIQPVYVKRVWVEWAPREKGGGIVARYPFDKTDGFDPYIVEQIKRNKGSEIFDKKTPMPGQVAAENSVIDTRYFYFNFVSSDGLDVEGGAGVMACSGSKIKKLDQLIQAVRNAKGGPAFFASLVRLTTFQDKQKKPPNKVFKNIQFSTFDRRLDLPFEKRSGRFIEEVLLPTSDDLYQKGRDLYMDLKSGTKTADYTKEGAAADRGDAEDEGEKRHF